MSTWDGKLGSKLMLLVFAVMQSTIRLTWKVGNKAVNDGLGTLRYGMENYCLVLGVLLASAPLYHDRFSDTTVPWAEILLYPDEQGITYSHWRKIARSRPTEVDKQFHSKKQAVFRRRPLQYTIPVSRLCVLINLAYLYTSR